MARPKLKTTRWDSTDCLKTPRDIADYLNAVLDDGDPALVTHALGIVARARARLHFMETQKFEP